MNDIIKINDESIASPAIAAVFSELSSKLQQTRKRKTHPNTIKTRAGKSGETYKYIKPNSVYQWLDRHYPLWSMEVIPSSYNELSGYISIAVQLTVIDPTTLQKRTITRYGSKEAILKRDSQNLTLMPYLKSAETDALKRCCVALGGFNDVYMDSEDIEMANNAEDRKWYIEEALPIIKEKPTFKANPEKLFAQMLAFDAGTLSKQQIIRILNPMENL
jgi:recombination DNA repair RAD52 pathway protein